MITVPNRLKEVRKVLEEGQPIASIDCDRLDLLQMVDMVIAGREFAEEAAQREEEYNEWIKQHLGHP